MPSEEAHRNLSIIIDWGRYAELFAYNTQSDILSLENPQIEESEQTVYTHRT